MIHQPSQIDIHLHATQSIQVPLIWNLFPFIQNKVILNGNSGSSPFFRSVEKFTPNM